MPGRCYGFKLHFEIWFKTKRYIITFDIKCIKSKTASTFVLNPRAKYVAASLSGVNTMFYMNEETCHSWRTGKEIVYWYIAIHAIIK